MRLTAKEKQADRNDLSNHLTDSRKRMSQNEINLD
jgi:hypothetical protein